MQSAVRVPVFIIFLALVATFVAIRHAADTGPAFTIESAPPPAIDRNLFNYEGWKRVLLDALGRIREGEPLTQSQEAVLEIMRQKLLVHKASEKELAEELLALLEMVLHANDQFFKDNPDEGQQRSDEEHQPGGH